MDTEAVTPPTRFQRGTRAAGVVCLAVAVQRFALALDTDSFESGAARRLHPGLLVAQSGLALWAVGCLLLHTSTQMRDVTIRNPLVVILAATVIGFVLIGAVHDLTAFDYSS